MDIFIISLQSYNKIDGQIITFYGLALENIRKKN